MNVLPLISSPISEPWTGWVMLGLLLCMMIVVAHQPSLFTDGLHDMFSSMDRSYSEVNIDILTTLLLHLFRWGVVTMTVYLLCYRTGDFSFATYALIGAAVAGVEILKTVLLLMMNYAFSLSKSVQSLLRQYNNIWLVWSVMLYVLCLMMIHWGVTPACVVGLVASVVFYVVALLWRIHYLVQWKILALLYVPLYLVLLEIMPVAATLWAGRHFVMG